MEELFKQLKNLYPNNYKKIIEAYEFAKKAHEGITRKSGEPYIVHPIEVAKILMENNLDYFTIMAGFLHDVVEDTTYTLDDIKNEFGETVAKLVDGMTKIDSLTAKANKLTEADSVRRLIVAMGDDIRVIFIKLADRLHNMRTVSFLPRERQIRMAKETNELFIPIAEQIGIRKIRSELQDLTFRCLYPDEYNKIKTIFDSKIEKRKDEVENFIKNITKTLKRNGIESKICYWPERYYSIYKKINSQGISKVYDLFLCKLIVPSKEDCYKALGIIHSLYDHLPNQIQDYIAQEKINGYKSLQTILIGKDDITFKVMIRTKEMDSVCEYGVSSMWFSKDQEDIDFGDKYERFNKIKSIISNENYQPKDSDKFISVIKNDLNSNNCWVFTPKYKLIKINADKPTAIDFAYMVHTNIGNNAIGAIVNGKKVSLASTLNSGDVVEIITSKEDKSPSRDWLFICKTTNARKAIREYFSKNNTNENIVLGKNMLKNALAEKGLKIEVVNLFYEKIARDFSFSDVSEMFASIGYKSITLNQVLSYIPNNITYEKRDNLPVVFEELFNSENFSFSKCCMPLPGEEIVALKTRNGFAIHSADCLNVKNVLKQNQYCVKWNEKVKQGFDVKIKIIAKDVLGLGAKILTLLSNNKYFVTSIFAKQTKNNECEFIIGTTLTCIEDFEQLKSKLMEFEEVKQIFKSAK